MTVRSLAAPARPNASDMHHSRDHSRPLEAEQTAGWRLAYSETGHTLSSVMPPWEQNDTSRTKFNSKGSLLLIETCIQMPRGFQCISRDRISQATPSSNNNSLRSRVCLTCRPRTPQESCECSLTQSVNLQRALWEFLFCLTPPPPTN